MSDHTGHRGRLTNRFNKYGLDTFDDHNVLELLLFYALPRQDTNMIAHALMERFKSLSGVFDADISELCEVSGIGEHSAILIKMIPQITERYLNPKNSGNVTLTTSKSTYRYLRSFYEKSSTKLAVILFLDVACGIINTMTIDLSNSHFCEINVRSVVEAAVLNNATSVIVSHNHLNGIPIPSTRDRLTVYQIRDALDTVGIDLIDMIVIAGEMFTSTAKTGL